ncbi:uncharacterized protein LOC113513117 [Galleria mellonella]|uniref:Uncharacterized protein LOC113513117 n=1 Tax=Galleria mellonella TaxID=7137 RepID=A0ABM3N0E3_GALME|nr:uncharacterized protein LOC113513117 [Galleria mellonella]
MIKERLGHHRGVHHKQSTASNTQGCEEALIDTVSVSPTSMTSLNISSSRKNVPCQISRAFDNMSQGTHSNRETHVKNSANGPLKKTETWDGIAPENNYKNNLKSEIIKWLQEIPIYPNFEPSAKLMRENMMNELLDELYNLSVDVNCGNNEENIRKCIYIFLNNLPMWYPGATRDQELFVERLTENLFQKIKWINEKTFVKDTDTDFDINEKNSELNKMDSFDEIEENISDILIDNFNSINSDKDLYAKVEICDLLRNNYNISEPQASNIAVYLVKNVRCVTDELYNAIYSTDIIHQPCHSGNVLVLTSEHEIAGPSNYSITLPSKQSPKIKKEISKLNIDEQKYMSKVATLIRAWMDTLPEQFSYSKDKNFKETIIYDLAGDIMDEVKLEQFAPHADTDRDIMIKYFVYKWLLKFDILEDLDDPETHVNNFMRHLEEIPVPVMTKPQHGNRQVMDNIKHMQGELAWKEYFVPKGIDILEDEISIWMNEQPSSIYINKNKDHQNKAIHELAEILQVKLKNKCPETEITQEVTKWLNNVIVLKKKINIDILTDQLKERIIKLPQDATLAASLDKKLKQDAEVVQPNITNQNKDKTDVRDASKYNEDLDKTLLQLIDKYIEHNYNAEDAMAKGAFCELLKSEFRKLSPPTRKQLYKKIENTKSHKDYHLKQLDKELLYIKIISDWLKNIPINHSYNTPGNKQRIEFVNNLAENIYKIEMDRLAAPTAMDYNVYLASIINQYIEQLPILPEHVSNITLIVNQLISKIVETRSSTDCQNIRRRNSSIDDKLEEQNLEEFIEQYIHINSKNIADDQVKLDAWTKRVLQEIKTIVQNSTDPTALCKAEIYNKLSEIHIPEDEIISNFNQELTYAKEISDWLNNLPLLSIKNSKDRDSRIKMITELAEKISEIVKKKTNNIDQVPEYNTELENFITKWILELPLNTKTQFSTPVVIQQLMKRIDKDINKQPTDNVLQTKNKSNRSSLIKKSTKTKPQTKSLKNVSVSSQDLKNKNAGTLIMEAIENWCRDLPIAEDNKDTVKTIKDDIAKQLFQRVGDLNLDPRFCNDDLLYQDILSDEIDTVLENLPRNPDLLNNWEDIKTRLIRNVMDAKTIIKEKSSGENYKQKLAHAVEASIPIPIQNKQNHDPGFELYKNHLVNMFILENFDHGNGMEKLKYEMKIKDEIDKLSFEAQKRNAVSINRDQLYNELYSALFKVPIPDERSVIKEIEKIKTKYVIEDWFKSVPLKKVTSFDELLQWDQILSMLAKRIHEIENNESTPDIKIQKEISKWLYRLPINSEHSMNMEEYINQLQTTLKNTKDNRKYVGKLQGNDRLKNQTVQKKSKTKGILGTSQIAGPSSAGQIWRSPTTSTKQPCCQKQLSKKKPADLILEIVENWCADLPLNVNGAQINININEIKDDLVTKIVIIISELNADPKTFNDDLLFDNLFDNELENILSTLPVCCTFQKSKEVRKFQLMEALNTVKPLIKAERARHEYKEELKRTISIILDEPQNTTADKLALFNDLKEEIVNNFIQYNYKRDNIEEKQIYKYKVDDALLKYILDIANKKEGQPVDPMIIRNQLLCELAKTPIPNEDAIREIVEEINMKNAVEEFLNQSLPADKIENRHLKKQVESSLAKRLHEIEKSGHNCANDKKIKEEIVRSLRKLIREIDEKNVEEFVRKLKDNELDRKASPIKKPDSFNDSINMTEMLRHHSYSNYEGSFKTLRSDDISAPPGQLFSHVPVGLPQYSEEWLSLERTTGNALKAAQGMTCKEVCNTVAEQNAQLPHISKVIQPSPTDQINISIPFPQAQSSAKNIKQVGHNYTKDNVQEEVVRSLRKFDSGNAKDVKAFVSKCKDNNSDRKSSPDGVSNITDILRQHGYSGYKGSFGSSKSGKYLTVPSTFPHGPAKPHHYSEEWLSLQRTSGNALKPSHQMTCNKVCNTVRDQNTQLPHISNDIQPSVTYQIYVPISVPKTSTARESMTNQMINSNHIETDRFDQATGYIPIPTQNVPVSCRNRSPVERKTVGIQITNAAPPINLRAVNQTPISSRATSCPMTSSIPDLSPDISPANAHNLRSRTLAATPGLTHSSQRRTARSTPNFEDRENSICDCTGSGQRRRKCFMPRCWDDFGPMCWRVPHPGPCFFYY